MLFQKLMMSLREAGEKDGTWRAYATNGATVMLTEGGLGSGTVWRRWRSEDQRWHYLQDKPAEWQPLR